MILDRVTPLRENHLIKEQAGFQPGKSCMIQHIEDGYQRRMITGAAFVHPSAAYDTVNQRIPIQNLSIKHRTVNYIEFSIIGCPTEDSMWN